MKILFVTEYYYPHIGGVETLFEQVATRLCQMGHECHIVTIKLENTLDSEERGNVIIHRVKTLPFGRRYFFTILAIMHAIKIARKCDIIHTTTYTAAIPAWIASKITRKKCIITVHEVWREQWHHFTGCRFSALLHRFAEWLILTLPFKRYCCVSNSTNKSLVNIKKSNKKNIVTVYNGIDYEVFNPIKTDANSVRQKHGLKNDYIYLYYGRPGVSKGLDNLIKAVPLINKKIENAQLLLLLAHNPADNYKRIMNLIEQMQISDSVILIEPVPRVELPSYIAAADCVVVPSLAEGFGFTAAEACAMEIPVVATRAGSLPEVVSGKFILVEPGLPLAIAEGVTRASQGRYITTPIKIFNWDTCVLNYLNLYKAITAED